MSCLPQLPHGSTDLHPPRAKSSRARGQSRAFAGQEQTQQSWTHPLMGLTPRSTGNRGFMERIGPEQEWMMIQAWRYNSLCEQLKKLEAENKTWRRARDDRSKMSSREVDNCATDCGDGVRDMSRSSNARRCYKDVYASNSSEISVAGMASPSSFANRLQSFFPDPEDSSCELTASRPDSVGEADSPSELKSRLEATRNECMRLRAKYDSAKSENRHLRQQMVAHTQRKLVLTREEAIQTGESPCRNIAMQTEHNQSEPLSPGIAPRRASRHSVGGDEDMTDVLLKPWAWGLYLSQLKGFHDEVIDGLEKYCHCHKYLMCDGELVRRDDKPVHYCMRSDCEYGSHAGVPFSHIPPGDEPPGTSWTKMLPNMHAVVDREIKTRSKGFPSYALMTNPQGLRIDTFISHTWNEPFRQFVSTLAKALNNNDRIWVCSFALNQHNVVEQLHHQGDIDSYPFALALERSQKLVVALDEDLEVPERAWCTYELYTADAWGIPTMIWFTEEMLKQENLEKLKAKVDHMDMQRAQASNDHDLRRIQRAIMEDEGFEALNEKLRNIIWDKIRFYEAMISQESSRVQSMSTGFERQISDEEREASFKESLAQRLAARQREQVMDDAIEKLQKEKRHLQRELAECTSGAMGRLKKEKEVLQRELEEQKALVFELRSPEGQWDKLRKLVREKS